MVLNMITTLSFASVQQSHVAGSTFAKITILEKEQRKNNSVPSMHKLNDPSTLMTC